MERFVLHGGTEEAWHALHASLHKAAEDAEDELPTAYAELRTLIAKTDPILLYGAIDVFDAMRRSNMPGPANFGSDAMVELLGGFVTSSDEVEMLNRIGDTCAPEHLQEADQLLRRIANLRFQASRKRSPDTDDPRSRVLSLLRLENDFDRMAGFDKHVRQIAAEVFGRVDDRVVDAFGVSAHRSAQIRPPLQPSAGAPCAAGRRLHRQRLSAPPAGCHSGAATSLDARPDRLLGAHSRSAARRN